MPPSVTYISFSNNSIAELQSGAFMPWRSLSTLFAAAVVVVVVGGGGGVLILVEPYRLLDNNAITFIAVNAFVGLDDLLTL